MVSGVGFQVSAPPLAKKTTKQIRKIYFWVSVTESAVVGFRISQ
ncbi:hypothetical protein D1AOALGA4SA_8721 [Olavius algarvensis Delta 1 endosymbiont]|nr:hypothetical protein D1AOALGA4SA_8721 [Olavius algarvensis Delta 1 endosymbiont]